MSAACSLCGHASDAAGPCPRCGGRSASPGGVGPRWLHTVPGRLAIGLIVGQGVFYALERLLTAVLLAAQGGTAQEVWLNPSNLVYLQAAQLFAALLGGVLAGGGQEGALSLGAIVGAWSGVLSIVFRQTPGELLGPMALYAAPVVHGAVAASGAAFGAWIWRPVKQGSDAPVLQSNVNKPKPTKPLLAGPIAWLRVAAGTAVAVGGALYAAELFRRAMDWSGGKLGTNDSLLDKLIVWELRLLALLLGGAVAGAMTANGLKQGLAVSVAASTILIGLQTTKPGDVLEAGAIILLSTFVCALLGGWFGGALFPPVSKYNPRKGAAAAQA